MAAAAAPLERWRARVHVARMPIHEYVPLAPPGCALCCYGFERLQRVSEPALMHCPACGGTLRRLPGAPQMHAGSAHVLRGDHLARHGFTQYRRVAKGAYEKTTGAGPDTIESD